MRRWIAFFPGVLLATAAAAQLDPPPANIDHFFFSPGGAGYILRNDDDPTNQGVDDEGTRIGDYYPNVKLLIDALAVDRLGPSSVGNPRGYHHGYTEIVGTPFGFLESDFNGGDRNIWYWDCANLEGDDCDNGAARANAIHMPAPTYRTKSNSCVRGILGHEIAHKWQRAYSVAGAPSGLGKWVTEGQARALQDKIYLDLDTDPEASCVATYLGQVKGYLYGDPSKDVLPDTNKPLWTLSYDAALFWTYLMEQLGIITAEPIRGIDFLVIWWEQSLAVDDSADSMEITEATIQEYDPSRTLLGEFRSFVLANLIKDMDLSTVSDAFRLRYSYRDEEQVADNPQAQYAEVGFADSDTVTGGEDGQVTFLTDHYAVQYFNFDVSGCPSNRMIKVNFDPSSTFFGVSISKLGAWGVVAGQGGSDIGSQRPAKFYKKVDEEWSVEFFQPPNPYENVYVTTTGVQGPVVGELTVECNSLDTLGPDLPLVNPLDPFTPGPPQTISYGTVGPVTLPPNRGSIPIKNLDPFQFEVAVGREAATVTGGLNTSDGYMLFVEYPPQTNPGPHDLEVSIGDRRTVVTDAVYHRNPRDNRWVYILMDESLSMGNPAGNPKLADATAAAMDYLRQYNAGPDFRVGLITHALEARLPILLAPSNPPHVNAIEGALAALTPLGPESAPGDAIELARTSFASFSEDEPVERPAIKEILLFSDGPLSFGQSWDAISQGVIDDGITIHTIALGQTADQPLLARIARETGGTYRYIPDDPTDGLDQAALARAMLKLGGGRDRQQIGESTTPFLPSSTVSFTIDVPRQAVGMLLPAVQAAREAARTVSAIDALRVINELDQPVPATFDGRVITLDNPNDLSAGRWTIELDTNEKASGELILQAFTHLPQGPWLETGLNLPEVEGEVISNFVAGDPFEFDGQIHRAAQLGALTETEQLEGTLRINDAANQTSTAEIDFVEVGGFNERTTGNKQDREKGMITESFTLNYVLIDFASPTGSSTGFSDEFSVGQRGSYNFEQRVKLSQLSEDGQSTLEFELIGHQSAAVADSVAGQLPLDTDFDGMPNRYEDRHECLDAGIQDATLDADEDQLFNFQEYERNTDPCDNDTDGGGELDGSEVLGGRDPLFGRDDAVKAAELSLVDHEITHAIPQGDLSPNSILIKLPRSSGYDSLTLKRGPRGGPLSTIANLDASEIAAGEYFDRGLTAGQEYCYRLEPFGARGIAGRPTRIFCKVASADPELPWGDVIINDGAPRTSNPLIDLALTMYNKDPADISMRFGINTLPSGNGIPFATNHQLQLPAATEPTEMTISVGFFKSALGATPPADEELVVTETITLMPPQSTGGISLRLTLFNPDGTPAKGSSTSQAMVQACAADVPLTHCKELTAYPAADGSLMWDDLVPGDYDVYAMGSSLNLNPIRTSVTAGQTTDLGDIAITTGEIFKSGFEGVSPF